MPLTDAIDSIFSLYASFPNTYFKTKGFVQPSIRGFLPTLCHLAGQPLPDRPLDGINLMPLIDGEMTLRPTPICFWNYDTKHESASKPGPYIDPKLQEGTTPLVKKMGGRLTRNFSNFRHPAVTEQDFAGPRAIVDNGYKLVIAGQGGNASLKELFDLREEPAEKNNLIDSQPETAKRLERELRAWQESVLKSLTGADYY